MKKYYPASTRRSNKITPIMLIMYLASINSYDVGSKISTNRACNPFTYKGKSQEDQWRGDSHFMKLLKTYNMPQRKQENNAENWRNFKIL